MKQGLKARKEVRTKHELSNEVSQLIGVYIERVLWTLAICHIQTTTPDRCLF